MASTVSSFISELISDLKRELNTNFRYHFLSKNKQKKVDACAEGRGACQYTCTDFNIQAGKLDASVSKGKKMIQFL
jgi:hypothetical protein